jgi:CubicO group peptidase (beta-lactamase class C family)
MVCALIVAREARAQSPDTSWQVRLDSVISRAVRAQRIPGLAVGIVRDGKLAIRTRPMCRSPRTPYNRVHAPSSGLMTNVVDMSRWAIANLRHGELDGVRILSATSYDILWKAAAEVEFCRPPGHSDCRKAGGSVGLSWFLQEKNGQLVVSHGGDDDGFITQFLLIPGRNFALIMMANSDRAGLSALREIETEALALADATN